LEDVSLAPGDDDVMVLQDISVTFRRGDCALISGGEGAGRSLLLSLLSGQTLVTQGRVQINGTPITEIAGDQISNRISLLSADFTLLEGTLLENMTAFEVDKYSSAAFSLAAELGIKDFILRHADGLEMRVAARTETSLPKSIHDGILLISGLARAPDVILFDEANAGLDRNTDLRMIEVLRRRLPDTILVLVTHRPSYKALANRLFTLQGGRLLEEPMDVQSVQAVS
jgi:ATP-binding cassette subfamily C protein LapB